MPISSSKSVYTTLRLRRSIEVTRPRSRTRVHRRTADAFEALGVLAEVEDQEVALVESVTEHVRL